MDIVNEELELVRQAVLLSARDLEPNQCIQMFNACLTVRPGNLRICPNTDITILFPLPWHSQCHLERLISERM